MGKKKRVAVRISKKAFKKWGLTALSLTAFDALERQAKFYEKEKETLNEKIFVIDAEITNLRKAQDAIRDMHEYAMPKKSCVPIRLCKFKIE